MIGTVVFFDRLSAPKRNAGPSESEGTMVVRAIASLAFVWIIAPHEPDLGIARPAALKVVELDHLRETAAQLLARVREDIEINRRTVPASHPLRAND